MKKVDIQICKELMGRPSKGREGVVRKAYNISVKFFVCYFVSVDSILLVSDPYVYKCNHSLDIYERLTKC